MFRPFARVTALLAALAVALPAAAAEEKAMAQAEKAKLSVGLSFTPVDWTSGTSTTYPVPTTTDVLVGFDLGAFRLEPSLGIGRYSIDGGPKGSDFNLGCGLLVPLKAGRTLSVYAGPRLFLGFVSAKQQAAGGTFSDSGVDLTLAGVLGAEWFADPHFSIGAEARLSYVLLSDLTDAGVVLRDGATVFATSGHVVFRIYL
jgi:hypothetical protein